MGKAMQCCDNLGLLTKSAVLCALVAVVSGQKVQMNTWGFGPWVQSSVGKPLPMPQSFQSTNDQLRLDPDAFSIEYTAEEPCEVVVKGIERYKDRIFNPARWPNTVSKSRFNRVDIRMTNSSKQDEELMLDKLSITLTGATCDDRPKFQDDEQYTLKISWEDMEPGTAVLSAVTVWGAIRGLDTFSQLVHILPEDPTVFAVNKSFTSDFPRYSWRGVLVDSSRHFLPLSTIKETIDIMEQNKMNVLHWHIVDDNSFPFESTTFPELSKQGRYHPGLTYTPAQVQEVIEHGRLRGVRVMPEFDTPGHTQSWGPAQPGLLTKCNEQGARLRNYARPFLPYGPIDPSKEDNYEFLTKLFDEVTRVFPDEFLHLGGDEVDFTCWSSNPEVNAFMDQLNITGNYAGLEAYYIHRLVDIVANLRDKKIPLVWQEVFDNNVPLSEESIVHVWIDGNWKAEMAKVTQANHKVLLSAGWYLNYISYGLDWEKYYLQDPEDFDGTPEQHKLVQGGELCMWGEYADFTNVIPRMWPRGSTIAERLWSSKTVVDVDDMARRMEEHRCRLLRRGHNPQPPNGSGFCPNIDLDA